MKKKKNHTTDRIKQQATHYWEEWWLFTFPSTFTCSWRCGEQREIPAHQQKSREHLYETLSLWENSAINCISVSRLSLRLRTSSVDQPQTNRQKIMEPLWHVPLRQLWRLALSTSVLSKMAELILFQLPNGVTCTSFPSGQCLCWCRAAFRMGLNFDSVAKWSLCNTVYSIFSLCL